MGLNTRWIVLVACVAAVAGLVANLPSDSQAPSPLLRAAYQGDLPLVQQLLPVRDASLTDAAFKEHVRVQANVKDQWNNTALHVRRLPRRAGWPWRNSNHPFGVLWHSMLICVPFCLCVLICQWAAKGGTSNSLAIVQHLIVRLHRHANGRVGEIGTCDHRSPLSILSVLIL